MKGKINRTNWLNQLDVVNCGEFHRPQVDNEVYACPAKGGAYSHKRCEFLGMYWGKSVHRVGRILGIVDVHPLNAALDRVCWNNADPATMDNPALIDEARKRLQACFPKEKKEFHQTPHRVFVLDELTETDFRKTSPGGMFTSKMYFDVDRYQPTSTANLAATLQTKTWAEYGR
ncbi:hypothetical protein Q5H93_23590 [Hymenobacter sp. ASUV-10]|uniref:Uncharacterized protein n=1 Tax=Hymenobacter aranciens TaxID=3063996 RepID=A0ABT9BHJ9_9BACT|nr:hypothetical protein [Hymenobacter sp. ASUV-10]MDO7877740.1 hypothetical protein [Hymenobacter sp. ASUV-10]